MSLLVVDGSSSWNIGGFRGSGGRGKYSGPSLGKTPSHSCVLIFNVIAGRGGRGGLRNSFNSGNLMPFNYLFNLFKP